MRQFHRVLKQWVNIGFCLLILPACRLPQWVNSSVPSSARPTASVTPRSPTPTLGRTRSGTIKSGGHQRTYELFVPSPTVAKGPLPVIFAFHPWEATGKDMLELSQFNQIADQRGAIVVYPDAFQGTWSDGRGATPAEDAGIDDVALVKALLHKLAQEHRIDRNRVFAAGYSNGGHFAQLLACDLAESLTAIAIVGSSFQPRLANRCRPARPISVMIMHGSEDGALPSQGIMNVEERWQHLPTVDMVKRWVELNGCVATPVTTTLPAPIQDGLTINRLAYQPCRGQARVIFYDIQGGGHTWPSGQMPEAVLGKTARNLDATRVIYDFFLAHGRGQ